MIIKKLLIANRGEIASRVISSTQDMGISCVAIYTQDDANSPYVKEADEAYKLEGSYLDAKEIISIAKNSGSHAIHPGYGFLSENAGFANSVKKAGIIWIGPSANVIKKMGDKITSKKLAEKAGVPTLPMTSDAKDAKKIGYPILVKASAGGGGKGMRIVEDPKKLKESISAAEREAESGFGDKRVFLERYVEKSRHIEIQILGDSFGNVVHLGERECSIQRRHQKIVEESPSTVIDQELRDKIGSAAVQLASALKYESAGTVEFLFDDKTKEFFFLEVNTRLQVEHPVTEEVTGLDLVKEQIKIAQGNELEFVQDDVELIGSSIEVRLYAEDPANEFLPVTGDIIAFDPCDNPSVRWDVGIEKGTVVSSNFDPMLGKVISYAETREEAAQKLALALERSHFGGMRTNRDYLISILRSEDFLKGKTTTDFVERVNLNTEIDLSEKEIFDHAVAVAMWNQAKNRENASVLSNIQSGWHNARLPYQKVDLIFGDDVIEVKYKSKRGGDFCLSDDASVRIYEFDDESIDIEIDGKRIISKITYHEGKFLIQTIKGDLLFEMKERFESSSINEIAGGLTAPMPGKVVDVPVKKNESVKSGQTLVILEAMKMEHKVTAPSDGNVKEVLIAVGDQVESGSTLVILED